MLRRIVSPQRQNLRSGFRNVATGNSTVDAEEVLHFGKFIDEWWNELGPMKALHSMNKLRIPFVRDGLINTGTINCERIDKPAALEGISILDVGSGGGILSESLAKLGGSVTGIDANQNLIQLAKSHSKLNNLDIKYIACSVEEHALENMEKYDAVVASEVIEHVAEKEKFLSACATCLKPTGSIFITTISKTFLANLVAIFFAENVFSLLPKGTHHYEKLIQPVKTQRILEDCNCRTRLVHGMFYNVFTNNWHWCSNTSVNYAIHAVKLKQEE